MDAFLCKFSLRCLYCFVIRRHFLSRKDAAALNKHVHKILHDRILLSSIALAFASSFFAWRVLTNDVALISFIPFTTFILSSVNQHKVMADVVVL